jgi:hypothetical protein
MQYQYSIPIRVLELTTEGQESSAVGHFTQGWVLSISVYVMDDEAIK